MIEQNGQYIAIKLKFVGCFMDEKSNNQHIYSTIFSIIIKFYKKVKISIALIGELLYTMSVLNR